MSLQRVNEFLLRRKKKEILGSPGGGLLVKGRGKINGLKEQTDLSFFPKEKLSISFHRRRKEEQRSGGTE